MKSERSSASKYLVLPQFDLSGALCAQTDPEVFFPEKGGSSKEAKAICSACEVRLECLEWAVTNEEKYGIWGGLTPQEREHLRGPRVTRGRTRSRKPITVRNTRKGN